MPNTNFLGSLGRPEYFALLLALTLTVTIALVLRSRRAALFVVAAAFLPPPVVALFSRQFDVVGWHAFMHASPIYQIMERGGAPEDPLFAGSPLRYPWAEFWLTAHAARLTGANPLVLGLIAQTFAYLCFIGAAAWLASALTEDRLTIALASLLSAFGISIFHVGLFAEPLARAFPPLWLETRVVPLDKFLSLTAMPIGYAAMLLATAAGVRFASGKDKGSANEQRLLLCVAGGTLVAVFIHPLSWLGVLAFEGTVALVLLASREWHEWKRAGKLALAVGVPSAVAVPYLRSVGASESSDGWMGFTDSAGLLGAKSADLAFFLVVFLVLVYLHRAELVRRLRARDRATLILSISVIFLSIAYLVVRAPGRNEYKFLLQLTPAAACLMALSLRSLLERHRALALGLLLLLLLPGARALGYRPWFGVTDPAHFAGQYQRLDDPVADELYQWVNTQTPADAVWIAADLRMPPLGRRSLFVPLDAPWRGRDGWGLVRTSLLQWHVRHPDAEMHRRQTLANLVLAPTWHSPPAQVMAEIQAAVPGRPLFVQTTSAESAAKLERTAGFLRRFANGAGSLYQWTGGVAVGSPTAVNEHTQQ